MEWLFGPKLKPKTESSLKHHHRSAKSSRSFLLSLPTCCLPTTCSISRMEQASFLEVKESSNRKSTNVYRFDYGKEIKQCSQQLSGQNLHSHLLFHFDACYCPSCTVFSLCFHLARPFSLLSHLFPRHYQVYLFSKRKLLHESGQQGTKDCIYFLNSHLGFNCFHWSFCFQFMKNQQFNKEKKSPGYLFRGTWPSLQSFSAS